MPPRRVGQAGSLVCASCNPTGGRPHGVEYRALGFNGPDAGDGQDLAGAPVARGEPAGWSTMLYQSRYLTDGGRLFFNSSDALVAQDTNSSEDVYEYEPPAGAEAPARDTCTSASATYSPVSLGCIDLISNGHDQGRLGVP